MIYKTKTLIFNCKTGFLFYFAGSILFLYGCTKTNPTETYITPISQFDVVFDTSHPAPTKVSFINQSLYATSYVWTINDTVFSTSESPTYTFNQGGTYAIGLKAIGVGGYDHKKRNIILDSAYSVLRITNIKVTNLPLATAWDSTSGPDIYLKVLDSTYIEVYNNSANFLPDVTTAQLPLNYDLSLNPIRITDFYNPVHVKVFDEDAPFADQEMGLVSFKANLLMKDKNNPYPTTLELVDGDFAVTLTLKWRYK